jgi:hypothetical protein
VEFGLKPIIITKELVRLIIKVIIINFKFIELIHYFRLFVMFFIHLIIIITISSITKVVIKFIQVISSNIINYKRKIINFVPIKLTIITMVIFKHSNYLYLNSITYLLNFYLAKH